MADSAQIGDVLAGSYRLTRVLGRGGMGEVYEAEHVRLPRRFAVKFLLAEALREPTVFERFRREAEIASSIGHANIVDVMDFNVTESGLPYMVAELLDGEELADRLAREGALPLDECFAILDQTAAALHAAHGHAVVHRDLKPQNIFLVRRDERDDFVKVLDFGISKVMDSTSLATRTGMVFGTLNYMSPEQADGMVHEIDGRTDIFALGTIAYEMLTGTRAFDAPSPAAVLKRLCYEQPVPLDGLRPDAPPDLVAVVNRALAKKREERFESMAAMRDALRAAFGKPPPATTRRRVSDWPAEAQAGAPPTTFTATAGERTIRSLGPRRRVVLLAAGGGALALALGLSLALGRSTPPPAVAPRPAAAAAAVPQPEVVELRVATDPPGATLSLDGQPAVSPLRAPRSDVPHALRVEAPGRRAAEQTVRFDANREIRVVLEASEAPAPAPMRSARIDRAPAPPAPPPRATPATPRRPAKSTTGPVMDDL